MLPGAISCTGVLQLGSSSSSDDRQDRCHQGRSLLIGLQAGEGCEQGGQSFALIWAH